MRAKASNEAGAQFGTSNEILPAVRVNFAPVGLTLSQTARLNLVNMDVPNGISVSCHFIHASGVTLAQSVTTLSMGKINSVDSKRHSDPLPGELAVQLRAQVQVQLNILTYGVSSDNSVGVWRYSITPAVQRLCT